jgi:hypothetical protein
MLQGSASRDLMDKAEPLQDSTNLASGPVKYPGVSANPPK